MFCVGLAQAEIVASAASHEANFSVEIATLSGRSLRGEFRPILTVSLIAIQFKLSREPSG